MFVFGGVCITCIQCIQIKDKYLSGEGQGGGQAHSWNRQNLNPLSPTQVENKYILTVSTSAPTCATPNFAPLAFSGGILMGQIMTSCQKGSWPTRGHL